MIKRVVVVPWKMEMMLLISILLMSHQSTLVFGLEFEPCLDDSDCVKLGHPCFGYMCYPWKDPVPAHPSCLHDRDCFGGSGVCIRHHNIRHIRRGVCFRSWNTCNSHLDCENEGQKCCYQSCCPTEYFEHFMTFNCLNDEFCQDLHLGDKCCKDTNKCCSEVESSTNATDYDTPLPEYGTFESTHSEDDISLEPTQMPQLEVDTMAMNSTITFVNLDFTPHPLNYVENDILPITDETEEGTNDPIENNYVEPALEMFPLEDEEKVTTTIEVTISEEENYHLDDENALDVSGNTTDSREALDSVSNEHFFNISFGKGIKEEETLFSERVSTAAITETYSADPVMFQYGKVEEASTMEPSSPGVPASTYKPSEYTNDVRKPSEIVEVHNCVQSNASSNELRCYDTHVLYLAIISGLVISNCILSCCTIHKRQYL